MRPQRQPLRHRGAGGGDPPRPDDGARTSAATAPTACARSSTPPIPATGSTDQLADIKAKRGANGARAPNSRRSPAGAVGTGGRERVPGPAAGPRVRAAGSGAGGAGAGAGAGVGGRRGGRRRGGAVDGAAGRRRRAARDPDRLAAASGVLAGSGSAARAGVAPFPLRSVRPSLVRYGRVALDVRRSSRVRSRPPSAVGAGVGTLAAVGHRPARGRGRAAAAPGVRSTDGSSARAPIAAATSAPVRAAWRQLTLMPLMPRQPRRGPARPHATRYSPPPLWPPSTTN